MSDLFTYLEDLANRNGKPRAILQKSLAFHPGSYLSAYPYIEPWVQSCQPWQREATYLSSGLWALHWREDRPGPSLSLGQAFAKLIIEKESDSLERRFITFLDASTQQLPNRLFHIVSLLKAYPLNFSTILHGLKEWNHEDRLTQMSWAKDFYHQPSMLPTLYALKKE